MDLESAKVSESVITSEKFTREKESYYPLTVSLKAGETYEQKWTYKVPESSGKSGKWNVRIKPHGLSMDEVIGKSTELYLDPWWDVSFRTQALITFSCPSVGCENNIATPVFFTSSDLTMSAMKAGGADLRYVVNCSGVNTERGLFISNFNAGINASIWINYTNTTGCSHHLYYNNSLASTVSSPYGVFVDYDNFSSYNSTKWTYADAAPACTSGDYCSLNSTLTQYRIFTTSQRSYPLTMYVQISQPTGSNKVYGFFTNESGGNSYYGYYVADTEAVSYGPDKISNRTTATTLKVASFTVGPEIKYLYRLMVNSSIMNLTVQTGVPDNAFNGNTWTLLHNSAVSSGNPPVGVCQVNPINVGMATANTAYIWWYGLTNGTRAPQVSAFSESGGGTSPIALMNISLWNYGNSSNFTGFYADIKNETVNLTKFSGSSSEIYFWNNELTPLGNVNISAWIPGVGYNLTTGLNIVNASPGSSQALWIWPNQLFNASNSSSGALILSWSASFVNNATWASFIVSTTNGSVYLPLSNLTPFGVWDIYSNSSGFWARHDSVNISGSSLLNFTLNFSIPPQLVLCNSSTAVILNFTYWNETGTNPISQTQVITFTVWSSARSNPTTYSLNFSSLNWFHEVCLWPGMAYPFRLDSFQIYGGNNSNDRNYFLYDVLVSSNATTTIPLYNLPASQTQLIQVSLRDASGIAVSGAFIQFQRYYPASNQYKTIAETMSDSSGSSNVYITPNDPFYQIIALSGSTVLYTFPAQKITCDPLSEPCIMALQIPSSGIAQYWEYYGRLSHYCELLSTTPNRVKCYYTDTSGIANWVSLECKKLGITSMTTICSQTNYSQAGSLVCDITNQSGAYSCYLSVKFGTNSTYNIIDEIPLYYSKVSAFGDAGLFITMLLVGGISLAGAVHPVSSIILAILALGGSWVMGLINISFAAVIALAVVGGILIYKMSRS